MDLNTVETVSAPRERAELWPLGPTDAVLAGGTWLFSEPQVETRRLVDLAALRWPSITVRDDGLELAATCTLAEVSALSRRLPAERAAWTAAPLFHQCCSALLASFKIWHTATVGGNVCLSFPAGSMISLASALDGEVVVWRPTGEDYQMPITEFVTGASSNVLAVGEVLRALRLPASALSGRTAFRKLAPSPLGRSGIVVIGRVDADGTFVLSITAATVRPYVFRLPAVDVELVRAAHAGIPSDAWTQDAHGDPDWRRGVSLVLAEEICAELGHP
ncbi:FAD-binding molybdopterin dehydrogenase [Mycolicibacterium madagascariense]|uniref:FAD-binding molybdopterin dehydrogenase n=1 Tax=Mycolicibacterium madagascariense TaxID=212765 RepID=A0A7I7XC08_9MYCO|nr:FAD binding domain-containing protein [Mycolicibacterium madagascariense]MCV7015717.1 FAD binding domain-containing protein [Mycolicibacterium madagascariense]BBZ27134.1 FAD-binding molybdopterin dehydrogenase [Mycolicibacterium madagascariense]